MSARHPFADGHAPEWAVAWGVDGHGAYADLAVGRVVQRMRWIPPGEFWMGSPEDEEGRSLFDDPPHWVRISRGYWLGDTPVTQALWFAVMGSNPSEFAAAEGPEALSRPVEQVSWNDVQEFLRRIPVTTRGDDVWRLPTDAEWERACRGNATTDRANNPGERPLQPWSEVGPEHQLRRVSWFGSERQDGTQPVKGKECNPLGLFDMLGNVWEWCSDTYGPCDPNNWIDPYVQGDGRSGRVRRGGSWKSPPKRVRAANRSGRYADHRQSNLGFRLARGPKSGGGAAFQQARAAGTDPRLAPKGGRAEPPDPGTEGGGAGREEEPLTLAVVAVVDRRGGATARVFDALRKRLRERGRGVKAASEVAPSVAQRWDVHRVVIWAERFDALDDEWRWPASGKGRVVGEWLEGAQAGVPLHVVAVTSEAPRWVEELSGVVVHRSLEAAVEALAEGEIPDVGGILRESYRREQVGSRAWVAAWCARWRRHDGREALEARVLPLLESDGLGDGFWKVWWLVEAEHVRDELAWKLHPWALRRTAWGEQPRGGELDRYWDRARTRLTDPVGEVIISSAVVLLQRLPATGDVWWRIFEDLARLVHVAPVYEGLRGLLRPRAVEWLMAGHPADDRSGLAKAIAGW